MRDCYNYVNNEIKLFPDPTLHIKTLREVNRPLGWREPNTEQEQKVTALLKNGKRKDTGKKKTWFMTCGWIINLLISAAAADRRLHFWPLQNYSPYSTVVIRADGEGKMEAAENSFQIHWRWRWKIHLKKCLFVFLYGVKAMSKSVFIFSSKNPPKLSIYSIYSSAHRFSCHFVCISFFFLSEKNLINISADNTLKQEKILYNKWQDKNRLLLCYYRDLICLPFAHINGCDEASQKNTYGQIKRRANKSLTTHGELWQLIKAHTLNDSVIN